MNKEYNDLFVENMKLKDKLEHQRKEYQETYKDVREEIKDYKKQLEEKDKVIKKQNKIINQAYTNIESTYSWRKEHSTPNTVNVPLMTLCEEQLEILERGKKCY